VHHALDVAEQVAADGIDVEVIDLRSLVPLDRAAIIASVRKTGGSSWSTRTTCRAACR
jgi:pyruvate dehydrogenase E1 component beta subunit